MAFGDETTKKFRLMNERIKNIENFLKSNIKQGKLEYVISDKGLPFRGSHGNFIPESPPRSKFGELTNHLITSFDQSNKPKTP